MTSGVGMHQIMGLSIDDNVYSVIKNINLEIYKSLRSNKDLEAEIDKFIMDFNKIMKTKD